MPYRRLPNTDAARTRALQTAVEKCGVGQPSNGVISYELFQKTKYFLSSFQSGLLQCRSSNSKSAEREANLFKHQKRAKMYITHYLKVLNMAIERGEIPTSDRKYYGLTGKSIPSLKTTDDIIEWGRKVIDGDKQRNDHGGIPLNYPRITNVKFEYDKFYAIARTDEFRLENDKRTSVYMNNLRHDADKLIAQVWDNLENHFSNLSAEEKRNACAEYGISYVWRKTEKRDIPVVEPEKQEEQHEDDNQNQIQETENQEIL